jgi:hypothetical protein
MRSSGMGACGPLVKASATFAFADTCRSGTSSATVAEARTMLERVENGVEASNDFDLERVGARTHS